ncbi:pleckstrin homology domain-containing family A member 6-like [Lethenteron reissneri]|uniref:pleckstrin homology domain-containing family A member 6-like n=1 Tax=Lethenteron reissneri TaxID=7753 RepID=UPI002AB642F1|nr:pleckstrin homology domain-containing family A member 6-like [Lethenteron reissneri]
MKVSQRKDDLDIAELERAVQDASAPETPAQEIARLRTAGTELDGSYDPGSEVSPPRHHVMVPERYVDEDPEEPLSPLEMEARQKNVERIKAMLAKSSVQNVAPLPSPASREVAQGKVEAHVQEQEASSACRAPSPRRRASGARPWPVRHHRRRGQHGHASAELGARYSVGHLHRGFAPRRLFTGSLVKCSGRHWTEVANGF